MIRTANLTRSVSRNAGGLFESVRRLVQSLQATGMEVCVFGIEDEHTASDVGAWAPVPVKAYRPWGPAEFGYSPQFRRELETFSPDLTHTHGLWTYPSVATNLFCRRRGAPYIISAHGMLDPWAVRHSRWKKIVAHFFYEGAHLRDAGCLRALCESEARAIRQLGLKNPIAIIPNGIDLPELRTPNSELRTPPWSGLVEPGRKVLLFLSRIHPKKGLANLIKAWAQIRKSEIGNRKSEEWVLAIAGWDQGGHEAELKLLATELEIPWTDPGKHPTSKIQHPATDQRSAVSGAPTAVGHPPSVLFLGPQFREAKAACYAHCDAFILPSFSEGVPMVVLEAWAWGKPVLMTPGCNLPEGFARGAAIRIEPTVESIEQGLTQLFRLQSSDLRSLGMNGHLLVTEKFAWPYLAGEMKQLYEWLLGGGGKPACIADF